MAKQGGTATIEMNHGSTTTSTSTSSSCSSDLSISNKPRVMKLDLITLPQFNVTYISRCLTVTERLIILPLIHPRYREFLYQPQCFPDMSFFPINDPTMYEPKILSSNGKNGITYLEINIHSKHIFIQRVALLAGMWNFKADRWNKTDWPLTVNIESLQLTLDYSSQTRFLALDQPPYQNQLNSQLLNDNNNNNDNDNDKTTDDDHISNTGDTDDSDDDDDDSTKPMIVTPSPSMSHIKINVNTIIKKSQNIKFDDCISPTTRKPIELKCRLRNLFFIRFDNSAQVPEIKFPRTLWGLGLQSFGSNLYSQKWWAYQIQIEQRFEAMRFLVLSCADFQENEFQELCKNTPNMEHISLRFVKWEGTVYFQSSLLSFGWFPDQNQSGLFSLENCNKLWQISTRLHENVESSADFLNMCSKLSSIHRVKFEYIKREEYSQSAVDFSLLRKWEERGGDKTLSVAITEDELNIFPIIKEIFPVPHENYIDPESIRFEDCPLWSDESKDFIHMTSKRKLLLR